MVTTHRRRVFFCLLLLGTALGPVSAPVHAQQQGAGLSAALAARFYPTPPMMASAAALLDADTGRWLYLNHADERRAMASTTKIMTALVAIRFGRLDDLYTVSHEAAMIGETTMGLREGERVPLRDLLYGLMLPSGNDAGIVIAEGLAGSQAGFAHMMNAMARDLGMRNTRYVTPHGLDRVGHYSSARDLVILARAAMELPFLRKVVVTRHFYIPATRTHGAYNLTNINHFIEWYPGADGVKPGYTGNAGLCLVESVRRNGHHLISAVLNTPDLYTDVRDLFNYGFGDFAWIKTPWSNDSPSLSVPSGTALDPALYFPFTGHSVRAGFLSYFQARGGLTTLGYPLTEEFVEDGQPVQYFTKARLVFDARTQASLPTPLGLLTPPDRALLQPIPPVANTSWRTYYVQTGHSVTWAFRRFFLGYGGVSTFGYPITEKVTQDGQLVQFFSNAKFIWHTSGSSGYVSVAPLGELLLRRLSAPLGSPKPQQGHPGRQPHSPTPLATRTPTPTPLPTETPLSTDTPLSTETLLRLPPAALTPTPAVAATSTTLTEPTYPATPAPPALPTSASPLLPTPTISATAVVPVAGASPETAASPSPTPTLEPQR